MKASNEVYGFSKLRRFLGYVNFMTQDTLRFLVQASLDEFVRYTRLKVVDILPCTCTIEEPCTYTATRMHESSTEAIPSRNLTGSAT